MQIVFLGTCSESFRLASYLEKDFSLTFFSSPQPFWSTESCPFHFSIKKENVLHVSKEESSFRVYYSSEEGSHYIECLCLVSNFTFDHFYYPANSFLFKDKIKNGLHFSLYKNQALLGDDDLLDLYQSYFPENSFYPRSQYDLIFLDQPKEFWITLEHQNKTLIKRHEKVHLLYRSKSLLMPFLSSYSFQSQDHGGCFFLRPENQDLEKIAHQIKESCNSRLNALKL